MVYVYLLKSLADDKYYIGQTDDIGERLKRHNSGVVRSTHYRRPLILLGFETFDSRKTARFREYELKRNASERIKFYEKFTAPS